MPNVNEFVDRAGGRRLLDAGKIRTDYGILDGEARILAALNNIQYVLELILEKMEATDGTD